MNNHKFIKLILRDIFIFKIFKILGGESINGHTKVGKYLTLNILLLFPGTVHHVILFYFRADISLAQLERYF